MQYLYSCKYCTGSRSAWESGKLTTPRFWQRRPECKISCEEHERLVFETLGLIVKRLRCTRLFLFMQNSQVTIPSPLLRSEIQTHDLRCCWERPTKCQTILHKYKLKKGLLWSEWYQAKRILLSSSSGDLLKKRKKENWWWSLMTFCYEKCFLPLALF